MSQESKPFSLGEEIAHSLTHGLGVWLATVGATILVTLAVVNREPWRILSVSIYGTTLVLLYSASTLYHSLPYPNLKKILRIADHCAIFLLIAGSYTPFTLVTLRGHGGLPLFVIVWSMAALGIAFKIFYTHRFEIASTAAYVLMGWMAVFSIRDLLSLLPLAGLWWMVAGGLSYTLGVVFFHLERLPYHHAIWHLFVLAGSICHFFAVLLYIVPLPAA